MKPLRAVVQTGGGRRGERLGAGRQRGSELRGDVDVGIDLVDEVRRERLRTVSSSRILPLVSLQIAGSRATRSTQTPTAPRMTSSVASATRARMP